MDPFGVKTTPLAIVVALTLAVRAQRKKTLTPSGAIAGCAVGFLIVATGLRGFVLLFFYQIGSAATKYKKSIKEQRDATIAGHAARGPTQVLAVSITPVALSLLHVIYCGPEQAIDFHSSQLASCLTCSILSHHATGLADTLASELGILSSEIPILITQPWRRVPAGTNGGITMMGTVVSLVGGAIIGLLTVAMDFLSGIPPLNVLPMIVLGASTGLIGSLLDSLIGATLQSSLYDEERKLVYHANSDNLPPTTTISGVNLLTNEQVNFVSSVISGLLGGWVLGPWIFNAMEEN